MKLSNTPEIKAFLKRCRENLTDERLNTFLDRKVTYKSERLIQQELQKAGSPEFSGPVEFWPSLFLSVDAFEKSPYHSAVTKKLEAEGVYERVTFEGNHLFNADAVQPDPNRELLDWMKLRALDRNTKTIVLEANGLEWMLDAPSEAATNDPYAEKAHGNVVTFGLGIGYFLYMALRNPRVNHVTVVEKDPDVIRTFEKVFAPLFPDHKYFEILEADAFDCWNETFLSGFDYIYADIWQSNDDGLIQMKDLLAQYLPPFEKADFWIEESCFVPLRTLIFLHYEELFYHTKREVRWDYGPLMKLVRKRFEMIPESVSDVNILKDYLYDRAFLRTILNGGA